MGSLFHDTVGTDLTQAEWEATGVHKFGPATAGDMPYASGAGTGVVLAGLPIGASGTILTVSAGLPSWNTTLNGDYTINGGINVTGNITGAAVSGTTSLFSPSATFGTVNATGAVTATGLTVNGGLDVTGGISGTPSVSATSVSGITGTFPTLNGGTFNNTGNANVTGTLDVTGVSTFANVHAHNVTGVTGNVSATTGNFANLSGTVTTAGTLNVTGNIAVTGTVDGIDVGAHAVADTGVHGVSTAFIAKTSNSDQTVSWDMSEQHLGLELITNKYDRSIVDYLISGYPAASYATGISSSATISMAFGNLNVSANGAGATGYIGYPVASFYIGRANYSSFLGVSNVYISTTAVNCEIFVGYALADAHCVDYDDTTTHIGFLYYINGATTKVYATNANATTQSRTELADFNLGAYNNLSLKGTGASVEWYVNGVLAHTETDYLFTTAVTWKTSLIANEAGGIYISHRNLTMGYNL